MSNTHRLKLPYILSSQAQKEVTHNKALEIIDVLLHASAVTIGENTPPNEPRRGDCYIVGSVDRELQNEWAGHPNALAYYAAGWNFIDAAEGMTVWVSNAHCHYTYDGSRWVTSFNPGAGNYLRLTQNITHKDTAEPDQKDATDKPDVRLQVAKVVPETCTDNTVKQK